MARQAAIELRQRLLMDPALKLEIESLRGKKGKALKKKEAGRRAHPGYTVGVDRPLGGVYGRVKRVKYKALSFSHDDIRSQGLTLRDLVGGYSG
jgi:hypothetical protein